MNEIQIFNNSEFGEVRTVMVNGEPYFVGKDVASALGYYDTNKAIAMHVDDDDKLNDKMASSLGQRGGWLINESGLYSLILSSKLPNAKKFKHWVTSEVLPSIRKTGTYSTTKADSDNDKRKDRRLALQEMNAKTRQAKMYVELLKNADTLSEQYKNILISKATEALSGEQIIPLPKIEVRTYSAGEIGQFFGISAQAVGRLANKHNLKTAEYGSWYKDKSPYSSKEVDTFRYNEKAIERFRELLGE